MTNKKYKKIHNSTKNIQFDDLFSNLSINSIDVEQVVLQSYRNSTFSILKPYSTTKAHGTLFYEFLIADLRELFNKKYMWESKDKDNIPISVAPDGSKQIVFLKGNENTGDSKNTIETNSRMKSDFYKDSFEIKIPQRSFLDFHDSPSYIETWFFLYYIKDKKIEYEISLPKHLISLKKNEHKCKNWKHRICFPSTDRSNKNLTVEELNNLEYSNNKIEKNNIKIQLK